MSRFYILPILAILAVIFVIRTVVVGSVPAPVSAPVVLPARSPYKIFVAGSGVVEAAHGNIAVASPLAGVIKQVFVDVGDAVKVGDPLFALDDREALAQLEVAQAQLERARAALSDVETQLSIYQSVRDVRAITKGELLKREAAVLVAKAGVTQAQASVAEIKTTLDRMTVRSPLDGTVLQSKARVGEFAPATALLTPLMVVGITSPLEVRVDVDENDAWRVREGAPATAILRGNTQVSFPLAFQHFEPYVIPKRSLTGESTERVDTRVLQVIYSFDRGKLPVYVGQLVDVFIDSDS
jgi:RND family efflux transporter MFP subunit